jgi:4-hydroxyphenylpyruvate dioxygenase-like putative hemolysin
VEKKLEEILDKVTKVVDSVETLATGVSAIAQQSNKSNSLLTNNIPVVVGVGGSLLLVWVGMEKALDRHEIYIKQNKEKNLRLQKTIEKYEKENASYRKKLDEMQRFIDVRVTANNRRFRQIERKLKND